MTYVKSAAKLRYVNNKISHMRRMGLVSGGKSGLGQNGGAAPDWLVQAQEDEDKRREKAHAMRRHHADSY